MMKQKLPGMKRNRRAMTGDSVGKANADKPAVNVQKMAMNLPV